MKQGLRLLTSCLVVGLLTVSAHATIKLVFTTVHSGGTPAGASPWATMTISDISGGVQITLDHLLNPAAPNQFISELNLRFTRKPTGFNTLSDPFIASIGRFDGYIDAGLPFNAEIRFKVAPPAGRLLPGSSSTFWLLGVSEADFAGTDNSAMIHIQGIPPFDGSSKVIAPEPASMLALGTGILSLVGLRRRRR